MSNTENLPDEHFRNKLENLEITPSDRVWGGISSHLERSAITQSKRKVLWLWRLSMITLLVSLTATGYVIFGDHGQPEPVKGPVADNAANTVNGAGDDAGKALERSGSSAGSKDISTSIQDQETSSASSSNAQVVPKHGQSSSLSSEIKGSSSSNMTSSSGEMNVSAFSGQNSTGTQKKASETELYNEGSKLPRNELRHADPPEVIKLVQSDEPQADSYSSAAKMASFAGVTLMSSRHLHVRQQELASAFEELEYEQIPEGEVCPHWIVGINYTYGNTYRILKDNSDEYYERYPNMFIDDHKLSKSYYDSIESRSTGYARGLAVGYRLGRLTLKTGIEQSKYEWETAMARGAYQGGQEPSFVIPTAMSYYENDTLGENYAAELFIINSSAPPQFEDTVTLVHSFSYTSVPLRLSYSFTKPCSKVGVAVTGGAAASFLRSYTLTQDGSLQAPEEHYISKQSYQLIAGASVSYAPVRWFSIEVQPTYRRFIQPVNRQQTVKTYPYMLGVQGGLYFRF
jgi:hypothetical protein